MEFWIQNNVLNCTITSFAQYNNTVFRRVSALCRCVEAIVKDLDVLAIYHNILLVCSENK